MLSIKNKKELKMQTALGLLYKRSYLLIIYTDIEHGVSKADFYLLIVFVHDIGIPLSSQVLD